MSGKTIILITGANQGIGYETTKNLLLASPSNHILLGSRSIPKGEAAIQKIQETLSNKIKGSVEPIQIDVTDDSSVDAAASTIQRKFGRLDILVNNAGVSDVKGGREAARKIFETNVIGVISVTDALLPLLKEAKGGKGRVVFVSSIMGCIGASADPNSKYYGSFVSEYRASKAAVNMLMVQYHHQGVLVHSFDPGMVATYFGGLGEDRVDEKRLAGKRERGAVEPEVAAEELSRVIRGERDADERKAVNAQGVLPW